jgi:hypothetical protein
MKVIDVPAAAKVKAFEGGEERELAFKDFLLSAIDTYEPFGAGLAGIRQGVKVAGAVEAANGTVALEDADFDALKRAVEGCKWKVPVARGVEKAGYFAAFEKAQTVEIPTKK